MPSKELLDAYDYGDFETYVVGLEGLFPAPVPNTHLKVLTVIVNRAMFRLYLRVEGF